MPRLFSDTSRPLIYASLCYEIRKVKEILCGSDCTWQESLICGKRMTICPRRHKKEKYSDHCVFVEYFVWPSITKVQSDHAEWGEKKERKNGDVHRSEQTSQGLSDVYEINRLFHLFWSRMTGNYLLCPGRHLTLPAYTPIGAVAARLNSPSCCITCSMAARTMT